VNASFASFLYLDLTNILIAILTTSLEVPKIYPNFMGIMFQFDIHIYHFRCLRATNFFKADANKIIGKFECARQISLRTFLLLKMLEKVYGGVKAIPLQTKVCKSILA
jgi:hypothetical protein